VILAEIISKEPVVRRFEPPEHHPRASMQPGRHLVCTPAPVREPRVPPPEVADGAQGRVR
jgi:hypothetical protein